MKNIKILYLLLVFISAFSFGQQRGCTKHLAISAKMNFDESLKNNSFVIYLKGGIVSVITNEDRKFEKSYAVKYRDFGCVMPEDPTYYENYNRYVFNYLKEKYGSDCMNLINKNAFGLNN